MRSRKSSRVLLAQLEFPTWRSARHWSYSTQLGIEEGLAANGIDYLTVPIIRWKGRLAAQRWFAAVRESCAGKRFDQVWVEAVHSDLDPVFLQWLASLAPVRVALIGESLDYDSDEYARKPSLKQRHGLVEKRLEYMTHVLACDEKDADDINARGLARAVWWTQAVPERFICEQATALTGSPAVFAGEPYGERAAWLQHPDLKGLLTHLPPAERGTVYPCVFDALHYGIRVSLLSGFFPHGVTVAPYLRVLRRVRRACFALWLKTLTAGCAVVNLPHYGKIYSSRVIEAMAAGRPVISWEIPNRPRNRALFEAGSEILLYPRDDPGELARQIRRVQGDSDWGQKLATNAARKLRQFHTLEHRVSQILTWIEHGEEPVYG